MHVRHCSTNCLINALTHFNPKGRHIWMLFIWNSQPFMSGALCESFIKLFRHHRIQTIKLYFPYHFEIFPHSMCEFKPRKKFSHRSFSGLKLISRLFLGFSYFLLFFLFRKISFYLFIKIFEEELKLEIKKFLFLQSFVTKILIKLNFPFEGIFPKILTMKLLKFPQIW